MEDNKDPIVRLTNLVKALVALLGVLAALGVTSLVQGNPGGVNTDTQTKTMTETKTVATTDTTATPTPSQVAEAPPAGEFQSSPAQVLDLRDSTPPGVPEKKLENAQESADKYAEDQGLPDAGAPIETGGAQGYYCRKSYQSRGYGAFRSYFMDFVLHYTVGPNTPGWGDVYGTKNYLNNVGLSATFIIDFEGHCLQTVPLDRNPYTQGSFNQFSASVEIIATGKETRQQWLEAPLFKQGILAALARDVLVSHNLPVKFVDPVGCTPLPGYTDHNHLECGNDHIDVSPNFPFDVFARQIRAKPRPVCARACQLRAKHKRTHSRFRKNKCAHGNKAHHGKPRTNRYCEVLRHRNKAVHAAAKREHISLRGTF